MNGLTQEIFDLLINQGVFHQLCQTLVCTNGGECISHVLTDGKHKRVPEFCYCKRNFYGRNCQYQVSDSTDPIDPTFPVTSISNILIVNVVFVVIVLIVFFSVVSFALGRKTKNAELSKKSTVTRHGSMISRANSRSNSFVKTHSRTNSRNLDLNSEKREQLDMLIPQLLKTGTGGRNLEIPSVSTASKTENV